MKTILKRVFFLALAALALSGCAALDAAHIAGQAKDALKYQQYSDVELAKQEAVSECFRRASTDNQLSTCAMLGMATGMASTFAGRPTPTAVAPTTAQALGSSLEALAPYGAAAAIARSVSQVQAKDPVVVQQAPPVVVRPEVVRPEVVHATGAASVTKPLDIPYKGD